MEIVFEPSVCFPSSLNTAPSYLSLFLKLQVETVDPGRLGLGLFIICGLVISYLPQFSKIISLKSSRGISPTFLLIGAVGGAAGLANIVLLQASLVKCCFTDWSPLMCFENTLGLTQVTVQVLCFWVFLFLFILYFPRHPIDPANIEDAVESPPVEDETNTQETTQTAYIQALKLVNVIILTVLSFALITAVTLYLPPGWSVFVATVFGIFSGLSSFVLYLPQIVETVKIKAVGAVSIPTLMMMIPGNFLFALSLFLAPGANVTSYAPMIITGLLQIVLLALCLHYSKLNPVGVVAQDGVGEENERLLE
ncbi:hypothetical protein BDR26DRAFT_1005949 [Obelidium mucronatum]|nr:hypothetical protein BDR26DRAFT_1005949 [Obelidium mucronatum]